MPPDDDRTGGRPRLREPVRPADRPTRPRARRLLRAPAARHAVAELERRGARAIILSGGPMSVYDDDAPQARPGDLVRRIPVLGICYGAQLMAHELGGDVLPAGKREYGPGERPARPRRDGLFAGLDREQPVWMSHGDSITRPPRASTRPPRPTRRPFAGLPRPPTGTCTASSSTPRSSTRRAARTCCATS